MDAALDHFKKDVVYVYVYIYMYISIYIYIASAPLFCLSSFFYRERWMLRSTISRRIPRAAAAACGLTWV